MIRDLFINAAILITFISLENQLLKDYNFITQPSLKLKLQRGIISGILGCILMSFNIKITPDTFFDFRIFPIILSSLSGGFLSSLVTGLIIGFFRILHFGVTTSSIYAFTSIIITAIACPIIIWRIPSQYKKWIYSTLFSVLISSITLIILLKNMPSLTYLLLSYWISSSIIAVILYFYVNNLYISNQLLNKYKEESTKDFLTGLYNVRQFDKIFNEITSKLAENHEHLSLLFIDIDFFKKINDTYGHNEGDIVLKELGKVLLKTCRNFDIVSRNGGEEFSVLLMDCFQQQALIIAERVRLAVEQHKFILSNGQIIHITISIGVATYPDNTTDFNKLIKEADKALYKAKQTGRNKVVLAGD